MSFVFKRVYSKEPMDYIVKYVTTSKDKSKQNGFYEAVKDRDDVEMISRISSDGYNHWILVHTANPESLFEIEGVEGVSENRKAYAA